MVRRALVLFAIAISLPACSGGTKVLFVGDSLTAFPPDCAYPKQWAAQRPPGKGTAYNVGQNGTTVRQWLAESRAVPMLAERAVDAVVIALGTNDVGLGRSTAAIADDLARLRQQLEAATDVRGRHPRVFVATIPRQYNPPLTLADGKRLPPGDAALLNQRTDAANTLLRFRLPPEVLVDFDSWMPEAWDAAIMYAPHDGTHVGCGGHLRRAEVAEHVLGTL